MRKEIEDKRDQCGYARVRQYERMSDGFEYPTYMGLVDRNGKEIVPCKYQNIIGFYNDAPLACVELDRKWGYINRMGKEIVPCIYTYADDCFNCGLAKVKRNEKYGFINEYGKEIITCKYDDARIFRFDLCAVANKGEWGVINKTEGLIIPFSYDYIGIMGHDRMCVEKHGKYGLLDYKGKMIVPCEYDGLTDILSDGRIEYMKRGEHGFMDLNGNNKEILPF